MGWFAACLECESRPENEMNQAGEAVLHSHPDCIPGDGFPSPPRGPAPDSRLVIIVRTQCVRGMGAKRVREDERENKEACHLLALACHPCSFFAKPGVSATGGRAGVSVC